MATITPNGRSGRVGNEVYYVRNGIQYVRKRPRKRSKRRLPLETVTTFSRISMLGTPMIACLLQQLPYLPAFNSYNAVRGFMRKEYDANNTAGNWPLEAGRILCCQLNPQCDLRNVLAAAVELSCDAKGVVKLLIPELKIGRDLAVPAGAVRVKIKCVVVSSVFEPYRDQPQSFLAETIIACQAKTISPTTLILETGAPAKHLLLAALALEFSTSLAVGAPFMNDMDRKPVAVLGMGRVAD